MSLPTAAEAIAAVKDAGPTALDQWAPDIDQPADAARIAAWLGIAKTTIHRARTGDRQAWAEPDQWFGRSPAWTYRTIAVFRAQPKRGLSVK